MLLAATLVMHSIRISDMQSSITQAALRQPRRGCSPSTCRLSRPKPAENLQQHFQCTFARISQAKVTGKRQKSTRDSRVGADTKLLTVGTSSRPNLKAKARAHGKSKSKVTEISESDSSEQVEETWTPNTSAPQSSLSQVNTIVAGGGPSFRCFPFRWASQFVLSLARCLTLQDATPCCGEDLLHECGRPRLGNKPTTSI